MKLFVANFPDFIDGDHRWELFEEYGEVEDVTICRNQQTGEYFGYGFVEFADDADAEKAIKELNGKYWYSQRLKVSDARPREEAS